MKILSRVRLLSSSISRTWIGILFYLFVIGGTLHVRSAPADSMRGLKVQATLVCSFLRGDGSVVTNQHLGFQFWIFGENTWRLQLAEPNGTWQRFCDGQFVYHFFFDNDMSLPAYAGFIDHSVVPSGGYPVGIPWLAFASTPYLSTNTTIPAPWADPRIDSDAHTYVAEIKRPFPTLEIEWRKDTNLVYGLSTNVWLRQDPTSRRISVKRPTYQPSTFVAGRFQVLATTNIAGYTVPSEFVLERMRYIPTDDPLAPAGAKKAQGLMAAFRGSTHSIESVTGSVFPPLPGTKPVWVNDLRPRILDRRVVSMLYPITNHWITDVESQEFRTLLEKARAKHRTIRPNRGQLILYLILFAILAGFPLAVWLKGRSAHRNANQSSE